MSDDEVTDLFRTAARAAGPEAHVDPGALISRARQGRRRQRMLGLCAAVAIALVGVVVIPPALDRGDDGVNVATDAAGQFPPGWTRLPDPPLGRRTGATAARAGDEIVVVGGEEYLRCPPAESERCGKSNPLSDGAAFNLRTRRWRPMARSPVAFGNVKASVVAGDVFILAPCSSPDCPGTAGLLRYRPATDAWDVMAGPPGAGGYALTALGSGLVAYAPSDDQGQRPDWRLDRPGGRWTELPDDPLPRDADRQMFEVGGHLVLFAKDSTPYKTLAAIPLIGARLDLDTGAWTALPPHPGPRVVPGELDGLVVMNPAPGLQLGGGTFDPAAARWSPLPAPPPSARGDAEMAGALGEASSVFTAADGWVFDLATREWIELPRPDEDFSPASAASLASIGRRLFLFGDDRLSATPGQAWVWTPAPARGDVPAPPPADVPTSDPPPPTAPPVTPTPSTPPTPGAPQFVSAGGDAAAGRITVRFDRPVVAGSDDKGPNGNNAPKSVLAAMSLIVFGADPRCSLPQGNGHEYLAGMGTDTITTDATSMAAGTTYVALAAGFVKSAADGTPNDPVQLSNAAPAGMFPGMSCIPVPVSGTVPGTPPMTEAVGGPELLSATGDGAAGRVTLRFSRPVVVGVGAAAAGPGSGASTVPPSDSMAAMQLVVHTTDSTCSSPKGNAQQFVAGVGTDTITVEATSLVVGTTYISISPGFVKAADDGKWLRSVPCLALQVRG